MEQLLLDEGVIMIFSQV